MEPYRMGLHALRLGDVALVTYDFELFTEFGSDENPQPFIIQLAGPGSYGPTERAAHAGGYSAIVHSNQVGPEGGQVLTKRTIEALKSHWAEK